MHFRGLEVDINRYIDSLAAKGRCHLTTENAAAAVGSSPVAVRAAIRLLREKARVPARLRG
jgi:hypothetical protein